MLAYEMQEARGKVEKTEPQSDSLRAGVALAESREAQARDELKAAIARAQEAIKALEAARQNTAPAVPSLSSPNDRALLQNADRNETLATNTEKLHCESGEERLHRGGRVMPGQSGCKERKRGGLGKDRW